MDAERIAKGCWHDFGEAATGAGHPADTRVKLDRLAKAAYVRCRAYGLVYQELGPEAKRCIAWLESHHEQEFPAVLELAPRGLLWSTGAPPPARFPIHGTSLRGRDETRSALAATHSWTARAAGRTS